MKLRRHVLIFLVVAAMATLPLARTALAQDVGSQKGTRQITSNQPKVMATAEEQIPTEKKPGIGKYMILGVLGVALVALAAGGGGGGGGDSTSSSSTGTVEIGW